MKMLERSFPHIQPFPSSFQTPWPNMGKHILIDSRRYKPPSAVFGRDAIRCYPIRAQNCPASAWKRYQGRWNSIALELAPLAILPQGYNIVLQDKQ